MRDAFEETLLLQTEYSHENTPAMQRRGQLIRREIAGELRLLLPRLIDESGIADLGVEGRDGTGLKTEIPWTRAYSESRSPSATEGWYIVYLFSAKGDRVYLSINQGTTRWDGREYRSRPKSELDARVSWARQLLSQMPGYPGAWIRDVQLNSSRKLGRGYEWGNVVAAEYALDSLPSDAELEDDLVTAARWLGAIYTASDNALNLPGEAGPELADAQTAIELNAGKARRGGQGFRLSTAEKRAVEQRAVDVVTAHLVALGFAVTDVGLRESFDLDARKSGEKLKVEVKGTTSAGSEILLTANEVALHLDAFPDNALGIVHSIVLDRGTDAPTASGGNLVFESPWELKTEHLIPMSYRYATGLD
jgi:hypothetical protein